MCLNKYTEIINFVGAVVVETLENEKKWKFESLALNTPKTKYSIDGTGTTTPHGFDLDVVAHYDKEHVKIKGNFKRKDKNGYNQLTVLPSQYPDFNLNAKWDYYYDPVNGKVNIIPIFFSSFKICHYDRSAAIWQLILSFNAAKNSLGSVLLPHKLKLAKRILW